MIHCRDCEFFIPLLMDDRRLKGRCVILLPAWADRDPYGRQKVAADNGCHLGQPRDAEGKT